MASDNFNRADSGTLGANWTELINGFQIFSDTATPTNFGANQFATYNGAASGDDQYSEGELAFSPYIVGVGINLEDRGGSDGVSGFTVTTGAGAGSTALYRTANGVNSAVLWSDPAIGVDTDLLKITRTANIIQVYLNGVQIGPDQDVSMEGYDGAQPGIFGTFTGFDNFNLWNGGDTTPPAAGNPWLFYRNQMN